MNPAQRLVKNTSVLMVSQIIGYVLAFFYSIYSARYLGVEGFGVLSAALAFAGIFSILTDLGLSNLTVREVARDHKMARKYLSNAMALKILLSILTFILIAVLGYLSGYPQEKSYVLYFITLSLILNSFGGIFNAIFQAYEKMEYQSITQILNNVMMFVGIFLAIGYQLNIVAFAFVYFAASAFSLILTIIICLWKFIIPKIEFDFIFWKAMLIEALPIAVSGIFALIAFRVDMVMLEMIKGSVAVGWYSAAYRLMEALLFFPSMYTLSVYPLLSKFYVDSRQSLEISYYKSFKYLTIISVPIVAATTLLAPDIILLIYKSSFSESIIALQILIWALPFIFLSYVLGSTIVSVNKQVEVVRITFITMIINIGLNLVLIPSWGFIGAACVTVITEIALFISYFYIVTRHVCFISPRKVLVKPVVASLVMCAFLVLVQTNLFLEIGLATVIYFAVLFIIKGFSQDDINILKRVLGMENRNEMV
jgi:Membrane protein involved in the export of O-antigen and teichoic acid